MTTTESSAEDNDRNSENCVPHKAEFLILFSQAELNDIIRDLDLPKNSA